MNAYQPLSLAWCWYFDTPNRTMRVEIHPGDDYLIVVADQDSHPQDWAIVLKFIAQVCPASPHALSVPEYDGNRDLWTAVYDRDRLRKMLDWP